jgi:hypothetical protein
MICSEEICSILTFEANEKKTRGKRKRENKLDETREISGVVKAIQLLELWKRGGKKRKVKWRILMIDVMDSHFRWASLHVSLRTQVVSSGLQIPNKSSLEAE